MKNYHAFFISILTIVFTLTMFGHYMYDDNTKTTAKKHNMPEMLGKPTVDTTVEGLHMKVWLMTQKQHKKMMKGNAMKNMNHDGMKINKAMKEAMMAGTHHIMLEAEDSASGKNIPNANAKVMIIFPSKKESFIDLTPTMNHFSESLTLGEKGLYRFIVGVNDSGFSRKKEFKYLVK